MSIGRRIHRLRSESHITQRELSEATGLAVSYLSRVENGKLTPTVPTLTKIADALSVPLTALFDATATLEARDTCPVSLSGKCILDHLFVGRGRKPTKGVEGYSREQLEALRLCNFLLHTGDKEILRTLLTMLKGLLALKQEGKTNPKSKTLRAR
jgi:transcriptional regulator with XRE-family HTH domain